MSPKKANASESETFTHAVSLRLTDKERKRLDRMAVAMPLTVLMRRAMAVGLDAIEADPSLMFDRKVRK